MPAVGPELPPHLVANRKRRAEVDEGVETALTPDEKPTSPNDASRSSSPASESKRRRTLGPERLSPLLQQNSPAKFDKSEESGDDDSDYGPSPPRANVGEHFDTGDVWPTEARQMANYAKAGKQKPQRDEWMTLPPKQDDLTARMDPTKIRARKFNTGKGAKGPGDVSKADNALWTETPEQKRKRLENEQLGIMPRLDTDDEARENLRRRMEEEDKARKIKEHNEKHRDKSLLSQHQTTDQTQKEDDPNKRAFDYDKDMGGTLKIGRAQKRELLGKAAQFGSKFSGGGFL